MVPSPNAQEPQVSQLLLHGVWSKSTSIPHLTSVLGHRLTPSLFHKGQPHAPSHKHHPSEADKA